MIKKNTDFSDLTQIPISHAKGTEDQRTRRQSMFVGHNVAGNTVSKTGLVDLPDIPMGND